MMTRWHEQDLAGHLVTEMKVGGEKWEILNLPALAGENDPVKRYPMEPLWPERYSFTALEEIKKSVGPKWWAALFQQDPQPEEGEMFNAKNFQIIEKVPEDIERLVRYWDLAATEADMNAAGGPCFTAGCLIGRRKIGKWVILDMKRVRATPGNVEALLQRTAQSDGKSIEIWIEQEPGSAGIYVIQNFVQNVLQGFTVRGDRVTGPKELRAQPLASAAESGNIEVLRGPWLADFLAEAQSFPNGAYKDQIDAAAGGFDKLTSQADAWIRFVEKKTQSAGNGNRVPVATRSVSQIPGASELLNGGSHV
jgi:predicted phage terminase large subunit-like protein